MTFFYTELFFYIFKKEKKSSLDYKIFVNVNERFYFLNRKFLFFLNIRLLCVLNTPVLFFIYFHYFYTLSLTTLYFCSQ